MKLVLSFISIFILLSCSKSEQQDQKVAIIPQNNSIPVLETESAPQPQHLSKSLSKDSVIVDLKPFKGVWIRKDLISHIQTTRSLFETWQSLKQDNRDDFLALVVKDAEDSNDKLNICISSFFTQMPPMLVLNTKSMKHLKGYQAFSTWPYEEIEFFIEENNEELVLNIIDSLGSKSLVFQRASNVFENSCSNQMRSAYDYLIVGNYQLLDKNDKIVASNIWFDEHRQTNFPGFKNYNIFMGYQNSIHHSPGIRDKTDKEKDSLIKEGAFNHEDRLLLHKIGVDYPSSTQYAIEKSTNGFDMYSLKEKDTMMWQLLYKKELVYKLRPIEAKQKRK